MQITLKDGSVLSVEQNSTCYEIAQKISEGLARNAVCAKVNGKLVDLSTPVAADSAVEIVTLKDKEGLDVYRHTCSHILAQAVKAVFPTCHLAIGPVIENGFYYDLVFKTPISTEDFSKIEDEMKKIKAELAKIEKDIPKEDMELYKTKRKDKIFPVLYAVQVFGKKPHCSRCGTEFPMACFDSLKKGSLVECDSCHRLVYYKGE